MLIVLSPAKKLLNYDKPYVGNDSSPLFAKQAQQLIRILKQKKENEIASLMKLSPALARLNWQRYQDFRTGQVPDTASYPALYLFQGDVYQALDAKTLTDSGRAFAQENLAILSGLYGLLRPLDRIQPYRLEMGTRLANPSGATLYDYWADKLAPAIDRILQEHQQAVLINLASSEYFKAIDAGSLKSPVLHVHFKEEKEGHQKVIGLYAKKARGLMARFIVENQVDSPKGLKDFSLNEYKFIAAQSDADNFVFVRTHNS